MLPVMLKGLDGRQEFLPLSLKAGVSCSQELVQTRSRITSSWTLAGRNVQPWSALSPSPALQNILNADKTKYPVWEVFPVSNTFYTILGEKNKPTKTNQAASRVPEHVQICCLGHRTVLYSRTKRGGLLASKHTSFDYFHLLRGTWRVGRKGILPHYFKAPLDSALCLSNESILE